jgi:peptidoglycan/xylan/chitin deacetylase (PgdA/CDA1 family)/SAM-dependent methyltransferase
LERALTAPTVSVIIPAFNAADTLRTALGSIQGQSFRRWEAVVVDDGSKDRTGELVASMAGCDKRIRYHNISSNRGPSAARNAGLAQAYGEYVLFLDADDWIGKHHLTRLVHLLRGHPPAGSAYSGYIFVTQDGRSEYPIGPKVPKSMFRYLARSCPFAIHSCLVKRQLVRDANGFDESLLFGEDWDLWQRLARRDVKFLSLNARSAFYRARRGSLTRACGRLIPDGLTVIRRGHAPDARVRAAGPEHELGAPAADLPSAMFYFLLWATGYVVGAGAGVSQACAGLPEIDAQDFPETASADTLLEGLAYGAGCARAELTACWTELWPVLMQSLRTTFSRSVVGLNEDVIRREVERRLAGELEPKGGPATLGRTRVVHARFEDAGEAIEVPEGVEVVRAHVSLQNQQLGVAEFPVGPGAMPMRIATAAVLKQHRSIFDPETRRIIRDNPRLIHHLLGRRALYFLWDLLHVPRTRWRRRLSAWLSSRINACLASRFELVPAQPKPQEKTQTEGQVAPSSDADPDQAPWDKLFATPDPWGYGSAYEQTKYKHTLELIPDVPISRALELACAEGHFTAKLAPLVGQFVAADISELALSRARHRCREFENVTFKRLNLRRDTLGRFDLIVCSEVLYYLKDRFELRRLAARLANSLNPGGHLLLTHANLVVDDSSATGFDWVHGFGARFIGQTFAGTPGLRLVCELRTPLYRVQLFRRERNRRAQLSAPEKVVTREAVLPADPKVYGQINWDGCVITRARAYATSVTRELPILMYHRIASHGPEGLARYRVSPESFERQLSYLKRHGYASIGLDDWVHTLSSRDGRLPGRYVCLTFDDGYRDFREHAWPLLKHYGFSATVFLPTDWVGGRAEWDCRFGEPAELLSWADVRELAKEGVTFGAHGAGHRRLNQLGVADMLAEGQRSQERLAAELGRPVSMMAYPYGGNSNLVRRAMESCGFVHAVTTNPGLSRLGDDPMALPRQEISGADGIEDFIAKLGPPQQATLDRRIRYYFQRRSRRNLWPC